MIWPERTLEIDEALEHQRLRSLNPGPRRIVADVVVPWHVTDRRRPVHADVAHVVEVGWIMEPVHGDVTEVDRQIRARGRDEVAYRAPVPVEPRCLGCQMTVRHERDAHRALPLNLPDSPG